MSAQPIKILYAVGQLAIGGSELQLLELIRNLSKDLFDIRVVCLSGPSPLANYYREIGLKTDELESEKIGRLRSLWKMYLIFNNFQPDIVHAYAYASRAVIPIAKLIRKIKIIISIRTYPDWNITLIEKFGNQFADLILTNSENAASAAKMYWPLVPTKVIRNGIDLDNFYKASQENLKSIPESASLDSSIKKICVVGRLASIKGHEDIISVFRNVCDKYSRVQLWIIGDGSLRQSLLQLVYRLGLENNVIFWGERNDVPAILKHVDIGINTSRMEGLSNAIIEYMAASLPVIATNVGGNSELITNEHNGFLILPNNQDVLNEKIMFLFQNPDTARKFGINGRKFVEDNLAINRMVAETQDAYFELLSASNINALDHQ